MCLGKLLTNNERKRRCMTIGARFEVCEVEDETLDHVLCRCIVASVIWKRLVWEEKFVEFMIMQIPKWAN